MIDDPTDIELQSNNQKKKKKKSGTYRVLANFIFNAKRNVTTDNSNYSYVTISAAQSRDNGTTWTPVVGTALPYDNSTTNQT